MRQYHGLRAEKIEFKGSSNIITSSLDNCFSVMAFTQAPEGSEGWVQCQEAVGAGFSDEGFGFWWVSPRGSFDPDV